MNIYITNINLLDVTTGELLKNRAVLIEQGVIKRIDSGVQPQVQATQLDGKGLTLMPGLCDAHVHVTAWTADISHIMRQSAYYTSARAAKLLNDMLMRGFTTVRDVGGADYGLAKAVDEDFIAGPRILYGGPALSQTGGHGDMRGLEEQMPEWFSSHAMFTRICDGITELRRACRDEVRKGAKHIKLMLSGGIASPTDRISNIQFSVEEVRAAVEEAANAGLYVVAHAYTTKTVNRALECGVRSLEHCNVIDESSIPLFLKHQAFMVPTLSTYEVLATEGVEAGLPESVVHKVYDVRDAGIIALELAHKAGVKLAYGTDLLGTMQRHQLKEFEIRARVQKPLDIIRAATSQAAELFNETGQVGVIAEGARADLLLVEGNPLENLSVLQDPEKYLKLIMKTGRIYKNQLA